MSDSYYNKQEKIKVLKRYLNNLFVDPNELNKNKYQQIKNKLEKSKTPLTKLIVSNNINYLKLSASILLTMY